MSTRVIKTPAKTSKFQQVVPLEGVSYTFVFRWNERSNHWFLTIKDASGNHLISGRKLVSNMPIGLHETIAGFPPGLIWCLDLGITEEDPRLRDLGDRVVLMYVDEANVS